jgi:hypothetical protein
MTKTLKASKKQRTFIAITANIETDIIGSFA